MASAGFSAALGAAALADAAGAFEAAGFFAAAGLAATAAGAMGARGWPEALWNGEGRIRLTLPCGPVISHHIAHSVHHCTALPCPFMST